MAASPPAGLADADRLVQPEVRALPQCRTRGEQGHLMLMERIVPQSEVIRAILFEDSPCGGLSWIRISSQPEVIRAILLEGSPCYVGVPAPARGGRRSTGLAAPPGARSLRPASRGKCRPPTPRRSGRLGRKRPQPEVIRAIILEGGLHLLHGLCSTSRRSGRLGREGKGSGLEKGCLVDSRNERFSSKFRDSQFHHQNSETLKNPQQRGAPTSHDNPRHGRHCF